MSTICLKTNQARLIENLRHAFNMSSMLGELLQNARRAGSQSIHFEVADQSITVIDDGSGIADLQTLIFIAESGWDQELKQRENAFGMGVLSTLYFAETLSVHSGTRAFTASTASIIRGEAIEVREIEHRAGTLIRLDGVKTPEWYASLLDWVTEQLRLLTQAFPVEVRCNATKFVRPLARPDLDWRETPVGRVLINLSATNGEWQCFLQGLPIGPSSTSNCRHVVLLRDDMIARLPDRKTLLNEESDHKRIQAAIDEVFRQALIEARERQSPNLFVATYGETCLGSENADLLNVLPFAPLSWFRDWDDNRPGFRRYQGSFKKGLASPETLLSRGVWRIGAIDDDDDDDQNLALAQVYVCASKGYLLEERRLDEGHWLMSMAREILPQQVRVQHGPVLYEDDEIVLAEGAQLALVDALSVRRAGDPETVAVTAARVDDLIYLTGKADPASVTPLVSDYHLGFGYSEGREADDEQAIATFIAVGSSQNPSEVIKVLLPSTLRFNSNPRLAGATVRLSFDEDGMLRAISQELAEGAVKP
jgi:hypothetical protein